MKNYKSLSWMLAGATLMAACASPTPTAAPPKPTEAPKPAATSAPAPTQPPAPTAAPKPTDVPKPTAVPRAAGSSPGAEYDAALKGEYKGKKVVVDGAFSGEDAVRFNAAMKDFSDKSGITIEYIGTKEFEKSINISVDSGKAPDIADFPQPGFMARFVAQGKVQDLSDKLDLEFLKKNYGKSWLDMATMVNKDGKAQLSGVWQRVNGKSLVWYPKAAFDKAGYKVPTTWDELVKLQEQIKKDGDAPWCIGIESGAATGWAFTDWVEEMMLRTTTPENYDKWVKNELKFDSPEVKKAVGEVAKIWFDDKNVLGGRKNIAVTSFGDAPKPMFDKPAPKCWLHKQGNFITAFFPKDVKEADYDFFYMPGLDPAYGSPVLVAGDIMAMFNDRPEVRAVMQAMTTADNLKTWLKQGGAISPHNDAKPEMYGSQVEAKIGGIIQKASTVRFDASDLMPGEVGAGSFWKLGTDYVTGKLTIDQFAADVDKSWPKSSGAAGAASLGKEYDAALKGEYKGKKVVIDGAFSGEDAVRFNNTMKEFADKTGMVIEYIGTKEFEKSINIAVDSGKAPDIADFPQPGFLARFVAQGKVVDLNNVLNQDWIKKNYGKAWLDMATMPGKDGKPVMAGVWERVNGKSLVWYPKAAFDKAGYKVPTTWDELVKLQEQIKKDGDAPWCIGIESGAATGWAFTDWVEEMMLRTTTPENYDKWVKNELKFDSPEVKKAVGEVAKIWFDDKNVLGGRKNIAVTSFGDAPKPMFDKPAPKCWLHKQGNFITAFFPKDVKEADYDFFYMPGLDSKYGSPVLVAGDIMAMFNDRPEVRAVMQYMTSAEHLRGWLKQGGAISPHNDAKPEMYGSQVEAKIGSIIQGATAVRFDASDLMPGEVGAGSFWKLGTDYVTGKLTLDQFADEVDKSWPKK